MCIAPLDGASSWGLHLGRRWRGASEARGWANETPDKALKPMPFMAVKISKRVITKPVSKVVLSSILRYENPGQLTIPTHLSLGNDGKLYLTRAGEAGKAQAKPQRISLKESVAWFRVGHQYSLNSTEGDSFAEWLKMIEEAVS